MSSEHTSVRRSVQRVNRKEADSRGANLRDDGAVGDLEWGDKDGMIRVAFQNVQGLGFDERGRKYQSIFNLLKQFSIDFVGIAETNSFWPKIELEKRIFERTKEWFRARYLSIAHNIIDNNQTRAQPGGVASMAINKLATRVHSTGGDTRKLGRWTWVRLQGKQGTFLRIITMYRPSLPTGKQSIGSSANRVHTQHVRALMKDGDTRQPRDVIMEDLYGQIEEWRELGDSIVLLGDFNEDVRNEFCTEWRNKLGLRDALIDRIGSRNLPGSHMRGKDPIDSIWVSANIEVVRTVVLPHGEGAGDHRAIMMDIKSTSVFGTTIPPTISMKARRLQLKDPRIVEKYLKSLHKFYATRDFYTNVYKLSIINIEYPLQTEVAKLYEVLDRLRVEGMRHAEKICRRFHAGNIPWSPELTAAHSLIEVWILVVRRLEGRKVHARTILRKQRHCKTEFNTIVSLSKARIQLHKAYQTYTTCIMNAKENRLTFLEDLAAARAKAGNTKAANELKMMQRNEKVRESWKRIHRMDGTARASGGINTIISPNTDGTWTEKSDHAEVVAGLLAENERRFTQANKTPLTVSPLKDDFGLLGTGPEAESLLAGKYDPPSRIDKVTASILKEMKVVDTPAPVTQPIPVSSDDLAKGWAKVHERTSSSPSKMHVGHWKASCRDPAIHWVNTVMINIPYLSGYSPKRWQQGINTMLEKVKGNCRVDKLRTILLYEADFNMLNKHIGRTMMKYAEKYGLIAGVQYGGRQRKSSNSHALNKRLLFDILRQKRKSGAICSCDLKSCYDRIVHAFAALAMRRAGVAISATHVMFDTIQKLVHKVRTAFGDSVESFGGEAWRELEPLFGVGQGNGAGPAIWAVISSIFFDVLKKNGFGAILKTPFSNEILEVEGFGYVDDTDILQTGLDWEDYLDITAKLQASVELWEKCTELSGGCLVPAKSWWTIVDFTWTHGHWKYTAEFEDAELLIKDFEGHSKTLRLLEPTESQKMLGVWLAPDGNNRRQIEEMRLVSTKWSEQIRTGAISPSDAWQALSLALIKKLEYPLVALTLTEKECQYIMAPALAGGLNRAKICSKIKQAVVYGNIELQGMGLHKLHTTLGIRQIQALLDHSWQNTLTGRLIKISLECLKLEVGIIGSLFQQDYTVYGRLATNCWLSHLWEFCWIRGITIGDEVLESGLLRDRDEMLSDKFAESFKINLISGFEWKGANRCRLYLQVLTISDIATGDGRYIKQLSWKGVRCEDTARDIEWPTQGRPSPADWVSWRKVLRMSLCTGEDRRLLLPLGFWLESSNIILPNWSWFWDPEAKELYQRHGHGFKKFFNTNTGCQLRHRRTGFKDFEWVPNDTVSITLERTTVAEKDGIYYSEGGHMIKQANDNPTQIYASTKVEELQLRISDLEGNKWAAQRIQISNNINKLIIGVREGTLVAVSDGSYKDGVGTASYIIECEDGSQRITGLVDVPGHEDEQNAYRSELAGVYGIMLMLSLLSDLCEHVKGHVIIACDGKGALHKAFEVLNTIFTRAPHFDILSGIHYIRRTIKCNMLPVHVKGHQDENGSKKCDRLATLNIECDLLAKCYWEELQPKYRRSAFSIPGSMWSLKVQGLTVGTRCEPYLRTSIEGAKLLEYWVHRNGRFSPALIDKIDMHALQGASKLISSERNRWLSKFLSGWCATGEKMLKWKKRVVDICPRCGFRGEDSKHILECKAKEAQQIWTQELDTLDLKLVAEDTSPNVRHAIITGIRGWKFSHAIPSDHDITCADVKVAVTAQNRIGWRQMIEGTISLEWRKQQDKYFQTMGITKSVTTRSARVIVHLWD